MKRLLSLTVAVILGVGTMFAHPVDVNKAMTVGQKFVQSQFDTKNSNLELTYTFTDRNGDASFYVFNVGENGFVIVSADDSFRPIVGYSDEGNYVSNPESDFYLNSIANGRMQMKNSTPDPKVVEEWNCVRENGRLLSYNNGRGVDILCATRWNQNPAPYNSMCPADPQGPGGHVYVGCVATAMAQIMKYWNYPEQGQGQHSYYCPGYGQQSANFGATTYDWANMLNDYDGSYTPEQGDAVALISYHCGVAVDMSYDGVEGSGAISSTVPGAISSYFRYSNNATMRSWTNNLSTWQVLLKEQLDLHWPVYYSGHSDEGGHAFICDGYNDNDLFHFNWGWGGPHGWYVANGIEYNQNMAIVQNFAPTPVYNATPMAPTNVTAVKTSSTSQEATITWTNPSKTLSNQDLTSIDCIVIERNGEVIYTSETATPGATMSYVDTEVPCFSTFVYRVYAMSSGNIGKAAEASESFGPTCEWKIIGTTTSFTGWKGATIVAYDGAGNQITSFTMTSSNPVTTDIDITLGKVVFAWEAGTDNVYLTFRIKDSTGAVVYEFSGNSNTMQTGVFYSSSNGCGNPAPTAAPTALVATGDGDDIILSWTGVGRDIYGYNVYRDGYLHALVQGTEYVDLHPGLGGHCYKVCALDLGGESEYTNDACANAGEGCDSPKHIWYRWHVTSSSMKPIITWDPAEGMTSDDGYVLYRRVGENGEWEKRKTLDYNKTEYKDIKNDFEIGTWYYYKIVASYYVSECISAPAKARYGDVYYVRILYSMEGVEEYAEQMVEVYPNPTKDVLTVKAENITNVVVYNTVGQKVFEQNVNDDEITINTNGFDAGMYMVRVITNGMEITRKISVIK